MSPSPTGLTTFRRGTLYVAAGLAFYGFASYIFTAIVLRALGPERFATFNVFWGLVYGVGLGVFFPFEQEVSRRVSAARHRHESPDAVLRPALRLALLGAGGLALVIGPLSWFLVERDRAALWLTTASSCVMIAVAYVTRGGLSGRAMFGRYAGQVFVEGLARLVLAAVLVVAALSSPWAFAAVVPVALLVAVVATAPPDPRLRRGDLSVGVLASAIGPLVVSSVISSSLANFGPVAVRYVEATPHPARDGSFLAAAFIARLPIFAFAAVQSVLIPRLVRSVEAGNRQDFAAGLRQVLVPTAGLAILGIVGVYALGPFALRILSGPRYHIGRGDMTLLTAGFGVYLLTLVLQPAAVALGRHRASSVVWLLGAATFALAWLLPLTPTMAVSLALVASCSVVTAGLTVVVRRAMTRPGLKQESG